MTLYPMSFREFVIACGYENYISILSSWSTDREIPDLYHVPMTKLLKEYFIVGGMPEAVLEWTTSRDFSAVEEIQEEIQKGESSFSIFIADINGLKAVNDAYGHACGNELIIEVSRALVEVFGNDCVYRIGGDEFAVVLKNAPAEGLGEMESKFEGILKMYDGKIKLSAAIGSASYDKTQDKDYGSVFEHADERMYAKKLQMKEQGDNSRIEE